MHCCSVPGVSLERDHLRSIPVKPARRQTAQLFNVSAGNGELGGKQVRLAADVVLNNQVQAVPQRPRGCIGQCWSSGSPFDHPFAEYSL